MRVLIDECLPRAMKNLLGEHACRTVQEVLSARSNQVEELEPLIPAIMSALAPGKPASIVRVAA